MPGPCNQKSKRKQKSQQKKKNPDTARRLLIVDIQAGPTTVPQVSKKSSEHIEQVLLQEPYIHDPGNGPRVRDTRAFLASDFFAQPPALDNPLCAEFAQEEVLQMLVTVLPEETALILWYNKSRATSRICPACQRLYHLGDILPDLTGALDNHNSFNADIKRPHPSPHLEREQTLSGLCSPFCFIMSSFSYPGAIKSAWGRTEEEMDDHTWELLNAPPQTAQGDIARALAMLVKMTRLDDLGLAQLCFGQDAEWLDEDLEESREEECVQPSRGRA